MGLGIINGRGRNEKEAVQNGTDLKGSEGAALFRPDTCFQSFDLYEAGLTTAKVTIPAFFSENQQIEIIDYLDDQMSESNLNFQALEGSEDNEQNSLKGF